MRQIVIILVLLLGIIGGGYYIFNPDDVYDNAAAVQMTEIVVDDSESTRTKIFSKDLMEKTISAEEIASLQGSTSAAEEVVEANEEETESGEEVEEIVEVDLFDEGSRTKTLVLRDGHISDEPKSGYLYSCQQNFDANEEVKKSPWIQQTLWYPNLKIKVEGEIFRKNSNFVIETDGGVRTLAGNGLPKHGTGEFPVGVETRAYPYVEEKNTIRTQIIGMTLPMNPEIAESPSCLPIGEIGILLSGVPLYSALTEEGLDAGARALEDKCGGHPDMQGAYHYHRESSCLVNLAKDERAESGIVDATPLEESRAATVDSILFGYAHDGFGIYASVEGGKVITNDDLDNCHGHVHELFWDGEEKKMYHYHMSEEYPYSLGCFKGTPIPN